jgi:hypothetical protein
MIRELIDYTKLRLSNFVGTIFFSYTINSELRGTHKIEKHSIINKRVNLVM